MSTRLFNYGGKTHNAPSSNVKDTNFKFPKHKELFTDDYYDDLLRNDADFLERKQDPYMPTQN
jgi:hypothetical protein